MQAEIITIGDEILIGQTIDTNSAWLGTMLNKHGIDVVQISSISDDKNGIVSAIQHAEERADLILITGGLGPTKDDITKLTLAKFFKTELILHQQTLDSIRERFGKRGLTVLKVNEDQALVPANCQVIENSQGTAPGMLFNENNKMYISMPGVPYEMKAMMTDHILPKISKISNVNIKHHTITVVGVPESFLAESISDIEDNLPPHLHLAYLPHLNLVRLRITGKSSSQSAEQLSAEIETQFDAIKSIIGDVWYQGEHNIAAVVGQMLIARKLTIGTIESCSGGKVAHALTSNAGSSAYFHGGLLTYAYQAKVDLADIPQELLNEFGAVSEPVARLMAENAKSKLGVDVCIATTGIAGPGGGTEQKPVGLVYIAIAKADGSVEVNDFNFHGNRLRVIERTTYAALNMVRKALAD